jgi:hypothetical protein
MAHNLSERKDISLEAKARLANMYVQLNPAELQRQIDQKTTKLWRIFSVTFPFDAL